jgi:hypothetical protein
MPDCEAMGKGFRVKFVNWPKQKWVSVGARIFIGKESDIRFIRVTVSFVYGIIIEAAW